MADPTVGSDGVEAGSSTTEWKAFLISPIVAILTPILNGLLIKFAGASAALTSDQVTALIVGILGLGAGYIGARTVRKAVGANGSGVDANKLAALKAAAAAVPPSGDPTARANALDAILKQLP